MATKGGDHYGNKSEAKERLIELRAQGLPYEAIASELGVSRQTLQLWSRDLRAEIESSKAIRIDALRAKFKLLQQHQVEAFGVLLENIRDELTRRDLADVPTHRLMDMFLKYSAAFNASNQPLEFVEKVEPVEFILEQTYQRRPMP